MLGNVVSAATSPFQLEEAAVEAMLSDETPDTPEARFVAKLGPNALDKIERYTTTAADPGFRPRAASARRKALMVEIQPIRVEIDREDDGPDPGFCSGTSRRYGLRQHRG